MDIQCNHYIIFLPFFHQLFTHPSAKSRFIQKSGERVPPLSSHMPAGRKRLYPVHFPTCCRTGMHTFHHYGNLHSAFSHQAERCSPYLHHLISLSYPGIHLLFHMTGMEIPTGITSISAFTLTKIPVPESFRRNHYFPVFIGINESDSLPFSFFLPHPSSGLIQ